PDARPLDHGVGIDRVDTDTVAAALLGKAPGKVEGGSLCRRVRRRVRTGHERVLRPDEDDRPTRALGLEHAEGFAGGKEVPTGEDVVVALPLGETRLGDRRARRDAG